MNKDEMFEIFMWTLVAASVLLLVINLSSKFEEKEKHEDNSRRDTANSELGEGERVS